MRQLEVQQQQQQQQELSDWLSTRTTPLTRKTRTRVASTRLLLLSSLLWFHLLQVHSAVVVVVVFVVAERWWPPQLLQQWPLSEPLQAACNSSSIADEVAVGAAALLLGKR